MSYDVRLTCQGQPMEGWHFRHLLPALWKFLRLTRRHGKYGTMRVDLAGW